MRIAPVLLFIFYLAFNGPPLQAGAWPREQGRAFVSTSVRLFWPQDIASWTSRQPTGQYYTFYGEYGLTNRLTLGADLGRSVSGQGKSVLFLRVPLHMRNARLKIATELGLGVIDGQSVLRPGLSVGLGLRNGWLSAEGLAEISPRKSAADFKLDLTWGWNLGRDRKLMLQMQTGQPYGKEAFARFASSIVLPLTTAFSAEIGGSWDLAGADTFGVLLGVWSEF
ncbi:hypothetical protein [Salipiger abyssi]|uniref:hypothetical protein n=1 Tax=Salipiger abyssi TaxID=1250539 RepID=UPI0040591F34